jgi:hypothetical protein
MRDEDWRDAGAGWQGKHGEIRLMGWSRQRWKTAWKSDPALGVISIE